MNDVNSNLQNNNTRKQLEKWKPIFIDSVPDIFPKILLVVDYNKRMKIKEMRVQLAFMIR